MSDAQRYVLDCIRKWTWAGYYSPQDVQQMIDDVLEEDCDEVAVRAAVEPEFARKCAEQASWPAFTDCDRLDRIFFSLHEQGIFAIGNAGYTMSDGYSDVTEGVAQAPPNHYHGYCFYHGQDLERAMEGHGLMIAFGDLSDREEPSLAVGEAVARALAEGGFDVVWNHTVATRMDLPRFDWKRRGPPNFTQDSPPPSQERTPASAPKKPWWRIWR